MSKLVNESSLQAEAFEIYYNLGADRSLQAVAAIVGRSKRTVQQWNRKNSWDNRLIQRALEDAQKLGYEALQKETFAIRVEYRKAIGDLITQAEKDIEAGKIQIDTVEDLERLIKLDLLLLGEPVDRKDII